MRKNLPPDQRLNLQVCSFTSYLLELGLQYCVAHGSNHLSVVYVCFVYLCRASYCVLCVIVIMAIFISRGKQRE